MDENELKKLFFKKLSEKIRSIIEKECNDEGIDIDGVIFQYFIGAYNEELLNGASAIKINTEEELDFMLDHIEGMYEEQDSRFWEGFCLN